MDAGKLTYKFGVEIELLLSSRKNHKEWHGLAAELSARLKSAGIANHINERKVSSLANYTEWSIAPEVSVPFGHGKKGEMQYGIELVSPVFSTTPEELWTKQLDTVFRVLAKHFTITPSEKCGTHVHVSTIPALASQPPDVLASVAKAALRHESALDALFPAERAGSYWAQSNREQSTALKDKSLEECLEYLDMCASEKQKQVATATTTTTTTTTSETTSSAATERIVRAMCLLPPDSVYGLAGGYKEDFVHGVFKWDFSGLIPPTPTPGLDTIPEDSETATTSTSIRKKAKGTLQFRQPPGSLSAEQARAYVELAVSFVAGAVVAAQTQSQAQSQSVPAPETERQRESDLDELWGLLFEGVHASGIGNLKTVLKVLLAPAREKIQREERGSG
ncbi:hypothetical protein F5Y17DRAFT_365244 [Xylariaceae sp. FL0594]|nr:hypothetical protein F5Y17DRAFT_365244 [Xylariaceae sp. FL0594]